MQILNASVKLAHHGNSAFISILIVLKHMGMKIIMMLMMMSLRRNVGK